METELETILIVEDNQNDVELTIAALSENNIVNDIAVAEDGVEALDFLYKRGKFAGYKNGNPAVILLDIKMPRMNGIEVLNYIRSTPKFMKIPVIIVTSSNNEKDLIESYRLGIVSYVVKPIDIVQFIDAIKTLGQCLAVINKVPVPVRDVFKF
jgi:two-component system response regulator